MEKILVVGGSGALGQQIIKKLLPHYFVYIGDYKLERAEKLATIYGEHAQALYIDAKNNEIIKTAIKRMDAIIIACAQDTPLIQQQAIIAKIPCIDVTAFKMFVDKVYTLDSEAQNNEVPSIVMAGFFPGFSGIMVSQLIKDVDTVDYLKVSLLQNTNANVGQNGIKDMLSIIRNNITKPFSQKRTETFLDENTHIMRLMHHDEASILQQQFGINNISYWTAWNNEVFNKIIASLYRLGIVSRILNSKIDLKKFIRHNEKNSETVKLTCSMQGKKQGKTITRKILCSFQSDYGMTATVVEKIVAKLFSRKMSGVLMPYDVLDLSDFKEYENDMQVIKEEGKF